MNYDIVLKCLYSYSSDTDGTRILVDALLPRGKTQEQLPLDSWCHSASPAAGLRQCWHRGELTEDAFRHAYRHQIANNSDCLLPLMRAARAGRLTLLSAQREPAKSHLPILRQALIEALDADDRDADGDEPSSPVCYNNHLS